MSRDVSERDLQGKVHDRGTAVARGLFSRETPCAENSTLGHQGSASVSLTPGIKCTSLTALVAMKPIATLVALR